MQITDTEFVRLLTESVHLSPSTRSAAEVQLQKYQEECADDFVESCTRKLLDRSLADYLRVAICMRIQSALQVATKRKDLTIWKRIKPESQQKIKEAAISSLHEADFKLRLNSVSLCGYVFVLEAAEKREWGELLDELDTIIASKNPDSVLTVYGTLEVTFECLKLWECTFPSSDKADLLIEKICNDVKHYKAISKNEVQTLKYFIFGYEIKNDAVLQFIFSFLTSFLSALIQKPDETIIIMILECFTKLVELYFGYFQEHGVPVLSQVILCYSVPSDKIMRKAKEFFHELIRQDSATKVNYLDKQRDNIFRSAFEILNKFSKLSKMSQQQIGLIERIISILLFIFDSSSKPFDDLFSRISEYMDSPEGGKSVIAINILGNLVRHNKRDDFKDYLTSIFSRIVSLLNECSESNQEILVILVTEVARSFPQLFFTGQDLPKCIEKFEKILADDKKTSTIITQKGYICICFYSLAEKAPEIQNAADQMAVYTNSLFSIFVGNLYTVADHNMADIIIDTIEDILKYVVNPEFLNYFFVYFTDVLGYIYQSRHSDKILRRKLVNSIFRIQSVILKRMEHQKLQITIAGKDVNTYLLDLRSFVLNISEFGEGLLHYGFTLVGLIAFHKPTYFASHIKDFIDNFLIPSMLGEQNSVTFEQIVVLIQVIELKLPETFEVLVKKNLITSNLIKAFEFRYDVILSRIGSFNYMCRLLSIYPRLLDGQLDKMMTYINSKLATMKKTIDSKEGNLTNEDNSLKEFPFVLFVTLLDQIYRSRSEYGKNIIDSYTIFQPILKLICQPKNDPTCSHHERSLTLIISFSNDKQRHSLIDKNLLGFLYDSLLSRPKDGEFQVVFEAAKRLLDSL
jgi:hypothetical protein